MLKEFAVDPRVIVSSFDTCRYLVSQFGADKGRLISKFPRTWKRLAVSAADELLNDGLNKERVVEYINGLDDEWLTLIKANRTSILPGEPWLSNAQAAHAIRPFAAIICEHDEPENQLVAVSVCDEKNPLFKAQRTTSVSRRADDIARPAALVLQNCQYLRLVDPYFDPGRRKWRKPLAAILGFIPQIRVVICEYHLQVRDDSPSIGDFIGHLAQLGDVIPAGGMLRIVRWREKDGGERFHRRYLLTNNAGMQYEGGLDEEIGADQTTDVILLDRQHHAERWAEYNLDAQVYELVEPVLIVDSAGKVTEMNENRR